MKVSSRKSIQNQSRNTHKFKSFSQRIDEIDVNIFQRVRHVNEEDDDDSVKSYYYQCIEKWSQLNLTEVFKSFQQEVRGIVTLNQVLYEKNRLIETISRYLVPDNYLALQPLLEILVAIAKDLQKEFYVHFNKVFRKLIVLLKMHRSTVIEWTFQCLAYLCKFLWRFIIKDLDAVLRRVMPLFRHPKKYMENFAACTFAFIGRKVRNHQEFLDVIVYRVNTNNNIGAIGCGKLLFEVIKGVDGHFHSCHEIFVPLFFRSVCTYQNEMRHSFMLIFKETIKNIFKMIKIENCDSYWESLITTIEQYTEPDCSSIINLLGLLSMSINLSRGRIPSSKAVRIIKIILKTYNDNLSLNSHRISAEISTRLLNSEFLDIPMEFTTSLISTNLTMNETNAYLYFVEKMVHSKTFDLVVLPHFLKYCQSANFSPVALRSLIGVILQRSPFIRSSFQLEEIKHFVIKFKLVDDLFDNIFTLPHNTDETINEFETITCRMIFISRLKLEQDYKDKVIARFREFINNLTEFLNQNSDLTNYDLIKRLFFLLYLSVESLIRIDVSDDTLLELKVQFMNTFPKYLNNHHYIGALKVLDLLFTKLAQYLTKSDGFALWPYLVDNVKSPFREVRLLTTHIFYLISKQTDEFENCNNIFDMCYRIESIKPTIATYRDQIMYMTNLEYDKLSSDYKNNEHIQTYIINHILAQFYVNFRLLWEPAIKVLQTYITCPVFWKVFITELKVSYENVKNPKRFFISKLKSDDNDNDDIEDDNNDTAELLGLYGSFYAISNRIDYEHYMMYLWKALGEFPNLAEKNHEEFLVLIFNFLNEDYNKNFSDSAVKWNVLNRSGRENDIDRKVERKFPKKFSEQYLIAQLKVLSKFRKMNKIDNVKRLHDLFLELLSNRNSAVQKVALDCLQTFKLPYVTLYAKHLNNLIDEKRMRSELVKFKIDPESKMIQANHRSQLIPLIFRILQSKLLMKKSSSKTRKNKSHLRKLQILRFLSQCQPEELIDFVQVAFSLYKQYDLSSDNEHLLTGIRKKLDFSKFPAPKRLLASLTFMQMVLEQFSNKLDDGLLKHLLRIVCIIGSILHIGINEQKQIVYTKYIKFFRNLRSICLKILNQFFAAFETYCFSESEIQLMFTIFIWSTIDYFPIENLKAPTTLLKLFKTWSENSKYYKLLIKTHPGDINRYPLRFVLNLLDAKTDLTSVPVKNTIMEIIENLLKSEDDDSGINGCDILVPNLETILNYFQWRLESQKTISIRLNCKELLILSKCSGLISNAACSQKMLNLLLPLVYKKSIISANNSADDNQDDLVQMLTTVKNLIKNVDDTNAFLINLSRLYSELTGKHIRLLLCDIFTNMSWKVSNNRRDEMTMLNTFLIGLNSWSDMTLEDMDSDKRLDTFKDINKYLESNSISFEFALYIIENCFYILKFDKYHVMRDSAKESMKKVFEYLCQKDKLKHYQKQYLIKELLFCRITYALKNPQNEDQFEDCIQILGYLSSVGSDLHPVLSNLNYLLPQSESDLDFFEYVSHLFMYRKAAALVKLVHTFKTFRKIEIHTKTLTHFIHPIVNSFLCNEKYAEKDDVINPAIEAVGLITAALKWDSYEIILRFYLDKLHPRYEIFHKQIIRIIVAILDSFHFNLKYTPVTKGDAKNNMEISQPEDNESVISDKEEDNDNDSGKILKRIKSGLLPHLLKSLAELSVRDDTHKLVLNQSTDKNYENDLLKIPISLAVVKLLQKLPDEILTANLQKVFMKMCTFLRSKSESIRKVARKNLEKMMQYLGPKYLNILLNEMFAFLNRGYQIHVLSFTIHAVVLSLKDHYQCGDLDRVLCILLEVCKLDIFGKLAEEKEVEQITRKISEAKSNKSYDLLQIIAQFISQKSLIDLLMPLKSVLDTTHTHKMIEKVDLCFRRIVLGLLANQFISNEAVLVFSYGIVSKSIPDLILNEDRDTEVSNEEKARLTRERPEDSFLIPKEPERNHCRSNRLKVAKNSNAPILVEFGLRLCYFLMKRGRVNKAESAMVLDPFIPIAVQCLESNSVRLVNLSIQCVYWFVKLDLLSLENHIVKIVDNLFTILHKYAAAGLSKGDNLNLVISTFKTISLIVRDYKRHQISEEQLKLLIMYIEQDLYNYNKQITAFTLLSAIISRKLIVKELYELMRKVAELSITLEVAHVRIRSRQIFFHFLMDYPLGKRLKKYISLYLKNLSYELEFGRDSAIEMMQMIVKNFPNDILKEHSGTIFVTMSAQLVNDISPKCRKKIATCLQTLLENLSKPQRDILFDMLLIWFKEKLSHRRLAAQACGLFVQVEQSDFNRHINDLLPLLKCQFNDKFLQSHNPKITCEVIDDKNVMRDHLYYQLMLLLQKLLKFCPKFVNCSEDVSIISLQVKSLLRHSHEWVRLGACQYFGYLLAKIDFDQFQKKLLSNDEQSAINEREDGKYYGDFLNKNPKSDLFSLTLDLCDQLRPGDTKSNLAEQVIKNLVFIGRIVEKTTLKSSNENKLSFLWIIKKLRKICRLEAEFNNSIVIIRTEIFKWIAAMSKILNISTLIKFAYNLLKPLVHESMSTLKSHDDLRKISIEVLSMFKSKLSPDLYTRIINKVEAEVNKKRMERKRLRAQLVVKNPELAAVKRAKLQKKKSDLRKRKAVEKYGGQIKRLKTD